MGESAGAFCKETSDVLFLEQDPINVHLFPKTTKILKDLEVHSDSLCTDHANMARKIPCIEAFFARMTPKRQVMRLLGMTI